jgi:S1-C subfamily serine protease
MFSFMPTLTLRSLCVVCAGLLISMPCIAVDTPKKAPAAVTTPVAGKPLATTKAPAAAQVTVPMARPVYTLPKVTFYPASAPDNFAPMLQRVLPAVVNIRADVKVTDLTVLFALQKQYGIDLNKVIPDTYISVGSGVIIDKDKGYIITNAHVVNDAQTITVTLDDSRHYTAKLIGLDKASDVALLQIKAPDLKAIPFAPDSSVLKVGNQVIAIGNPFGLNQSVTSGIVRD